MPHHLATEGGLKRCHFFKKISSLFEIFFFFFRRFAFPPEVLRRISSRITNEVAGINRVTYDISSKPPAVRLNLLLDCFFFCLIKKLNHIHHPLMIPIFFEIDC